MEREGERPIAQAEVQGLYFLVNTVITAKEFGSESQSKKEHMSTLSKTQTP